MNYLLPLGAVACLSACSEAASPKVQVDSDPIRDDAGVWDAGDTRDAADDDADASDQWAAPPPGCGWTTDKLDLLFIVDNSLSMHAEQELLAAELPRMVSALARGDVDGDGVQDHPAADIRVGVVSTDMGLAGQAATTLGCAAYGDDAKLQMPVACGVAAEADDADVTYEPGPGYLAYDPERTAAEDLACMVRLGIKGCGMEQQLEAMLKAVTPSTSNLRFAGDTLGVGDRPHANGVFLREDAVLAIVHLTDEDDCSLLGPSPAFASYQGAAPYDAVNPNYRCMAFPELLHPTSRYIDALKSLRPEGAIFYAIIAGIPLDLSKGDLSPREILDDPRMAYAPDNEDLMLANPKPVCGAARSEYDKVSAAPARRLLEVAEGLGDHAVVASICEQTFQRPIEAIAKRIGGVLACPKDPVIF